MPTTLTTRENARHNNRATLQRPAAVSDGFAELPNPPLFVEFELRFLLPLSSIEERLNLGKLPATVITQHYFSKQHLPYLRCLVAEDLGISVRDLNAVELTSARIRKAQPECNGRANAEPVFSLDLKGPKGTDSDSCNQRSEYSITIDKRMHERLCRTAERGRLHKTRYTLSEEVIEKVGRGIITHKGRLDIDLLHSAGFDDRTRGSLCEKFNFVSIDLEVYSSAALRAALKGSHTSQSLLSGAQELSSAPSWISEALSTRRIAKLGFDADAKRAVKKLRELWEQA